MCARAKKGIAANTDWCATFYDWSYMYHKIAWHYSDTSGSAKKRVKVWTWLAAAFSCMYRFRPWQTYAVAFKLSHMNSIFPRDYCRQHEPNTIHATGVCDVLYRKYVIYNGFFAYNISYSYGFEWVGRDWSTLRVTEFFHEWNAIMHMHRDFTHTSLIRT